MVRHPVKQLYNELPQAASAPAPAQAQGYHTSWWHSEKMVGTQIELLLLLYVVIGAIQVVGNQYRRSINSAYVKYPLWMAYSASQPLVAYTLGVMYNSPFKETKSLLTTLFIVVALGRVNTMTAYNVDDNKRYAAQFFRHVLFVVSYMSMAITIPHTSGFRGWYSLIHSLVGVFFLIFFLTMNGGRICANIMASSFSDKGSLYLQTHMKTDQLASVAYDPVSLEGYNYLVFSFDDEKKEHRKDEQENDDDEEKEEEKIAEVKESDDEEEEEEKLVVEVDKKNDDEEEEQKHEKDDENDKGKEEEIMEVKEKDDDNDNDDDDMEEEEEKMKEMDDDYDKGEEKSDDEDEPDHITVSMVWSSSSGPFSESGGLRLKELCLSFALFQLLRRRFFGADCPEAKLQKTHDLVFKGFLLDVESKYKDAYRIIETELAFTYDHFFSTTHSIFSAHGTINFFLGIFCVAVIYPSGIVTLIKDLLHYKESLSSPSMVPWGRTGILTGLLLVMLSLALELLQLYVLISSDLAKVELANRIVFRNGKPLPSFVLCTPLPGLYFRTNLPRLFGYWQNKIGQHSLIKDLHGKSFIADLVGSFSCLFQSFHAYTSAFPRGFEHRGVKKADRIPLTNTVKLAIAQTLKESNGQLSCGVSSLQRNFQGEEIPLWACNHETPARTMLIWHVATEYCVIAHSLKTAETELNHTVAQEISSYCAYLMVFVPELLPDHPLETTRLFHEVRNEALKLLCKDRTPFEKHTKMSIYHQQHETTFASGIRLGKKLEEMKDDSRWKTLADFWTEMILYVAPSDNAKDHIQHLANGGEFLTHLWALLSHAGILERDQQIHDHPPAECSAPREATTYADECRNDQQLDPLLRSRTVQSTQLRQMEVEMTAPMECRIDISEVSSSTKQP